MGTKPKRAQEPVRETIGQRLKRARGNMGLTALQVARRAARNGDHKGLGETTVLEYEKDKFPNPGLKTVERIALGLGLDPLEVISLGLDNPPGPQDDFKASPFAHLWRNYQRLSKERRAFWDELIKMLTDKMNRQS